MIHVLELKTFILYGNTTTNTARKVYNILVKERLEYERMNAMKIISYTIEQIKDPTGILTGERYEFFLDIEVDEDDELFSENGASLRVLFYKDNNVSRILNYHFLAADQILDFALDEDEEKIVAEFCNAHYTEIEE